VPFSLLPLDKAEQKLKELNFPHYVDLEFEPTDLSVFDYTVDSPFDVVVHWRRPQEFMKADF
jgi:hypothetical protein